MLIQNSGIRLLFLLAVCVYTLNRGLLTPMYGEELPFLSNHLNDLLFFPASYPVFVSLMRVVQLRSRDWMPSFPEMIAHLAMWSVLFEWIFPATWHKGTADWKDCLCYAAGMIIFGIGLVIDRRRARAHDRDHRPKESLRPADPSRAR